MMQPLRTIFLAGDSTCAEYDDTYAPQSGWGEYLHNFCRLGIVVRNFACCGQSCRSFRSESEWTALLDVVRPGDFVVTQFGRNDLKHQDQTRFSPADTVFREALRLFIREVLVKNANSSFATPTSPLDPPNVFSKYMEAVRRAAGEEQCDWIDIYGIMQNILASMNTRGTGKSLHDFPAGTIS